MTRRKKGKAVHGWLVLDKPAGMTSTQAVGAVRRAFDARKAGHAGTLDPLATGILPIALGEATKTVPYAVEGEKGYRFTVRWGAETDTDDAEGRIVSTSETRPEPRRDRGAAAALHRRDPADAAGILRHQDRRRARLRSGARRRGGRARAAPGSHRRARRCVDTPDRDTAVFEARCGKGTYVRALARDMGRALGCLGHVVALRRTRVGPFVEADAVSMDDTAGGGRRQAKTPRCSCCLPVEAALAGACRPQRRPERRLRACCAGQSVLVRGRDAPADDRAHLCHLQGPPDRRRPHREGRAASDPRVQFRRGQIAMAESMLWPTSFSLANSPNSCIRRSLGRTLLGLCGRGFSATCAGRHPGRGRTPSSQHMRKVPDVAERRA